MLSGRSEAHRRLTGKTEVLKILLGIIGKLAYRVRVRKIGDALVSTWQEIFVPFKLHLKESSKNHRDIYV